MGAAGIDGLINTIWVLPVSPETECQVTLRITLETSRWTWMVLLSQLFSISCCRYILLCESLVSFKGGNFLIFGSGAELWDISAAVTSSLQPATLYIPSFGLIGDFPCRCPPQMNFLLGSVYSSEATFRFFRPDLHLDRSCKHGAYMAEQHKASV